LPVELAWSRSVGSRAEALREEHRIKGLSREQKLAIVASA
jgi:predicted GIY-YIG superfamily endonuclease